MSLYSAFYSGLSGLSTNASESSRAISFPAM